METLKNIRNKNENENLEQSHSAEMLKRGDTLGFWHFSLLQIVKKNLKVGRDPLKAKKSKSRTVPKKFEIGDRSCKCSKSFWLKQGLEPVTAGCTVNRLKSLLKSGTYTMRSVLTRKKKQAQLPLRDGSEQTISSRLQIIQQGKLDSSSCQGII